MGAFLLPPNYPMYLAFGEQGNYSRRARIVGELPHSLVSGALEMAAQTLGVQKIHYGVPIYRTLNLTASELDKDSREWLKYSGHDLPLHYFWQEDDTEEEG